MTKHQFLEQQTAPILATSAAEAAAQVFRMDAAIVRLPVKLVVASTTDQHLYVTVLVLVDKRVKILPVYMEEQ